ncbi:MAG: homoserine dehydrogenase [Anaerolineae bacterium]|nr:homoserine dehydrogenase [Anaerolineae bacterium]
MPSPAEKRTWPSAASVEDILASSFAGFDDGIVVDVTAAEGMEMPLEAALRHGWGVVLANKKPLTVPLPRYRQLMVAAGRRLRYEATVGAGLPVIATLQTLLDTGDQVQRVEGCLSGTLGYLSHCLQEEMAFSAAVREARARGYTEPDPRQDLSGLDVARKALILARTLGLELELGDVQVEALFPAEMAALSVEEFMASLERLDGEYKQRMAAARGRGCLLRYVAEVEEGRCRVGWREVGRGELMAVLRGPDNIVCFHTARYSAHPLVLIGPGAGPEVTAAGVLGDILALAQHRRPRAGCPSGLGCVVSFCIGRSIP